jgi:hypothetical protein
MARAADGLEGVSGRDLEAAAAYVLIVDAPRHRLDSLTETSSQIAFRLGLASDHRAIKRVAGVLKRLPPPRPYGHLDAAVESAQQSGLKVLLLHAVPGFLRNGEHRRLMGRADAVVSALAEQIPLGTPAFYRRVAEVARLRPEEIAVIGPDPHAHAIAPRKAGLQSVLVFDESESKAPRAGQMLTVQTFDSAVPALLARYERG